MRHSFIAKIEDPGNGLDAAFITIPFDVEKVYGTNGQVKVKALFDGYSYRGSIANMGARQHILIVRKDVRQAIGKKVGDNVHVVIEKDEEERTVELPAELASAFKKNKKAEQFFNQLSYTNRKEYVVWITSAKKNETRLKRLQDTINKLNEGKKNPSAK